MVIETSSQHSLNHLGELILKISKTNTYQGPSMKKSNNVAYGGPCLKFFKMVIETFIQQLQCLNRLGELILNIYNYQGPSVKKSDNVACGSPRLKALKTF